MSSIQDRINAMKKGESSSKKTESAALNDAPKVQSIQDRLAKARSDGLKQTGKPASTAPTKEYDLSGEAWTRATPSQTKIPSRETDAQEKRGFFSRLGDAIRGGAKGSLASNSNAMSTFYAMGQGGRDAQNREYLAEYSHNLERAKLDMDAMLAENKEKPGSWSERDIQSQQYIIDDWQRKYDAMAKVLDERVQQKATQASYELADDIQQSSAQDIERAKEGLGSVGQVLVDAGASMTQTALDTAANALLGTPGSMGAFAMRAFGGGTQQARQDNPNSTLEQQVLYGTASAAKEVFTEKMFNIALPFSRAYGGGALDDAVKRGIRSAVNRFAKTDAGKRVLGGALTFGAGAVSEGLEEFIGDWMEWQMPRIYGGEAASAGETLENSLYDFLVGATSGMMGGVITPATYHYNVDETNTQQETTAPTRQAEAVPQTAAANELLTQAAEQASQNGRVNGKTADRILADQDAMAALEQAAGQVVQGGMTKSQQRKAVKSAVEDLARARETASGETVTTSTSQQEKAAETAQVRPAAQQVHGIKLMQQAASALGENGAKALNTVYDGNAASDSFYAGFVAYYEAGVSGMDMSKVRSEYSAQLNQAQKFAAYVAGQNDAEVSLARERRAAQYAKVAGTDSGLVFEDYVASSMDTATADRVNSIAKALGVRVRFVDSVRGGTANAQVSGSDILVEKNNPNPVMFLLGHEWTHRMQELAPDEYRAFRDAVAEEAQGEARVLLDQYRRAGEDISYEAALDEAAANYAGRMIEDGKVLDDFIEKHRDNRTLLEKVRDAIRSIISKLTGAERRQAQTAEGKLTAALEASAKQASALQKGGSVVGTEGGYAKVNGKFSLKGVVEDNGELLALHNLSEGKLLGDLELGGLPMPSIAIVQAQAGHAKYGEISLVFAKDTIDPKFFRSNKVYGGDAWTPTFPAIEYKVNEKVLRSIRDTVNDLTGGPDARRQIDRFLSLDIDNMTDALNRNGGDPVAAFRDSNGLKYAYLRETDPGYTPPTTSEPLGKRAGHDDGVIIALADTFGADGIRKMREGGYTYFDEHKDIIGKMLDVVNNYYREHLDGYDKDLFTDLSFSEFDSLTADAYSYTRNGRKQTVDTNALREYMNQNIDQAAYEAWLERLFDGIVEKKGIRNERDLFTPQGNRRGFDALHYEVTLENIVKAMKNDTQKGGGVLFGGTSIWGVATKDYGSISEIKKDSGRLGNLPDDEYEAIREGYSQRLYDLTMEIRDPRAHNSFLATDDAASAIIDTLRKKRTVAAIDKELRTYTQLNIQSDTAEKALALFRDISNMPVGYFEAKPQRAVGFDEVLAAIIPDSSSEKLRAGLERAGVRMLEYKSGDDADRLAKVNSVEGARFSLKTDSQGRTLTEQQREYFKDSKVVDEQGRLKIMYRGGSSEFTVFDRKKSSYSNLYGRGFYFTDSEAHARQYGNAREFYLNITNPVPTGETTITRSQMRKFLEAVAENEDDFSFENYGYGATVDSVLKSVYGKSDFAMLYDVSQTAIGDMVAAVELFNDVNGTGFDGLILDTETVAFYSDQIKNTTNQTPTKDPDIRHSLKGSESSREAAALQEENNLLRERVEYWKGQTRRTKRVTTDKKAVTRAARELIRSYGADLETTDISGELQSLYDYIASGYDGNDELTYTEAHRRAEAIAEKLVESAVTVDDDMYQQYSDLRSYLRTTKLTISEEDSHNIADYGDFRKRNMGRMTLTKGNTNIDRVYEEMAELWPEFFDPQRETHPADQLAHIAEVMDGIYDITEYNPFSRYMEQAVADAANEVMEMFFDLPQTRATFADRQARKLDDAKAKGRQQVQKVREEGAARLEELRKQNREKVRQTIEKERQRRETEIGKLKTRYREKDAAGRERRNARELRAKIIRHVNALSQKLLRPSDKQHIPEKLRQATAAALEAINLESAYSVDPATGKRVKDGTGTPTKRTEAFRQLRLAYADITKEGGDYTLIIDPDLMDNLNELEAMKDTPLMEMGTAQLETVWATVKAVEASIRTANKMLGQSRFQTISQFADGIKGDNLTRKDRGDYRGIAGWADKKTNFDMLTPQGYFHRLGKTGEEMFHMMRSAQDRHIEIMQQAKEATRKITGKADIGKLERETHTFDLEGGKLTMSTAQIMALYELMKRKQAQDHILKGGIRPEVISTNKGLRESRKADPVRVSLEDIATITGVLTEEQRRMADGLQKFMGGELAELGNEASMEVYGYRKFNERDYFPIQVDKNQTKRDIAKEAQAATIAGRGFTKSVTPHANNAVMVNSIFDVYASHVNDMATYAAWLPTMENIRRIRDFTFRDEEGNRTGDVKSIIERVFGKNGNPYLNKLVDDINQGIKPSGTGGLNALLGNYKAAAVAANLRVILQQPTAILRALDGISPKYLLAGTVKRGDWEKVMKYAPIARWKDWGYFDINTGRQMKDVLLNSDSALEKVKQASMAPAGKADSFAWARLWNAVEAETKDKRPGLKPGTEPFYQAVAERFSEIVDRTQVVDGLLQRSQIMRSPDALDKMATSFMGEPTKTYNMFVNAVYDLRHAEGEDGRKRAKRGLARTATALVTSFAINAVMQSIVDALRDDDKERDYWEKMLAAYTGFTGDEETFRDYWNSFWDGNLQANFNPLGYIPYAKDILSIAQGYDVSRMDMEPVSKVWEAAVNMKKALSGEGKHSLAGASANLVAEAARLLGIPVANLKRDVQAGITTAAIETDNYLMQYRIDKTLLNMGYSGNTSNFLDILYNASVNDQEAYEIIYADMVKEDLLKSDSQTTEQRIASGMELRMKKSQGVESVDDLERRFLSPAQTTSYERVHSRVTGTTVWNAASTAQREVLEDDLYALTVGNSDGLKLQEKIDGGAAYGIDEADYLLYRLALRVADQPSESGKLGSYTGDEVEAAIDMLPGLDDEARAYLWEAAGKSENSNPYK